MTQEESKDKCRRNRDNWKTRALLAESAYESIKIRTQKMEEENARLHAIIEDIIDTILQGDFEQNARDLAIKAKQKAGKGDI